MEESWLPILGYGNCYSVSNLGRIKRTSPRNIKRLSVGSRAKPFIPSPISAFVNRGGYFQVRIGPTGHQKTVCVHSLVAKAFIPNPQGFREVNHIDGDKRNNEPHNLEWVTRSGNMTHASKTGLLPIKLGEQSSFGKLTNAEIVHIRADSRLQRIIAAEHGISQTNVSSIKRRQTWSHV